MGRPPRILLEGYPYHIVTRCNNREDLFKEENDFIKLLEVIRHFKEKHGFKLYAYTLMSNHSHYIIEPTGGISIAIVMRDIMVNFAKWYNRKHERKGHMWESRYHSCLIEDDTYALMCMRYIHRNPVRAGIVEKAWDYPWSSVRHNTFGEKNDLIDDLISFIGLSVYPGVRMKQYKKLIEEPFDSEKDKKIFYSPFIGSERFKNEMKNKLFIAKY